MTPHWLHPVLEQIAPGATVLVFLAMLVYFTWDGREEVATTAPRLPYPYNMVYVVGVALINLLLAALVTVLAMGIIVVLVQVGLVLKGAA